MSTGVEPRRNAVLQVAVPRACAALPHGTAWSTPSTSGRRHVDTGRRRSSSPGAHRRARPRRSEVDVGVRAMIARTQRSSSSRSRRVRPLSNGEVSSYPHQTGRPCMRRSWRAECSSTGRVNAGPGAVGSMSNRTGSARLRTNSTRGGDARVRSAVRARRAASLSSGRRTGMESRFARLPPLRLTSRRRTRASGNGPTSLPVRTKRIPRHTEPAQYSARETRRLRRQPSPHADARADQRMPTPAAPMQKSAEWPRSGTEPAPGTARRRNGNDAVRGGLAFSVRIICGAARRFARARADDRCRSHWRHALKGSASRAVEPPCPAIARWRRRASPQRLPRAVDGRCLTCSASFGERRRILFARTGNDDGTAGLLSVRGIGDQ